tara:strand:- start:9165 stop:10271 length:1107 start_codon:yes stop_codon:yes gene_type:complete
MIRVFEPKLNLRDYFSVLSTLYKNNISGSSPIVSQFEKKLSNEFNRDEAIALSNGSVALDIAFQILNLKKDDEVIVPAFTIISCLAAIIRSGASPVFCDVDPLSWNMRIEDVESKVTPQTKAVLMVHTYGLGAEAQEIRDFCSDKNLYLIEDAAESHGQIINKQKCGTFGDISTFSFYANKHITTGEGGAILSDNPEFIKKGRQLINLDFNNIERFKHDNLYWNHRISGLQAALGMSQINGLEKVIKKKINQGRIYEKLLENYKDIISIQPSNFQGIDNHYWVFGILLKEEGIRDRVIKELLDDGIETRPFFWPLHLQSALPKRFVQKDLKLEVSENLGRNGLYIPIGSHISESDQRRIIKVLLNKIK